MGKALPCESMTNENDFHRPRHPIQVVARRTGLTADVLRAWERRYGAVEPERSPTGRRLYSDADVERLMALRRATSAGRSIGQVARFSMDVLTALIAEDETAAPDVETASRPRPGYDGTQRTALLAQAVAAVERLDGPGLEGILQNASLQYPRPALIESVIVPLMMEVGTRWRAGTMRIAHEHLASATVRSFLGEIVSGPGGRSRQALIIATPSGHRHELGAMMVAATAMSEGWDVVYLGPDLPAEEIAAAAMQLGARAVALSLVYPAADATTTGELKRLTRLTPQHVTLLIGGRAAPSYEAALRGTSVIRLPDLVELRKTLEELSAETGAAGLSPP